MSCSSKNATSRSAFSRLSAGSVARAGPEPPDWGTLYGGCAKGLSWSDAWHARSLESLEGVVSAVYETKDAVDEVRNAFEEVWRENATAAQVDAGQVDALSETSGTWCCFRDGPQRPSTKPRGPGVSTAPQRLLG
jgi:hypothetical protein